jgi:hypothetical protein
VAGEIAQGQRDHEHFLVIAHVTVVVVPGGQAHVEARVLFDHLGVQRPDEVELAVRGGQQRVEDFQAQVLLGGRHGRVLR